MQDLTKELQDLWAGGPAWVSVLDGTFQPAAQVPAPQIGLPAPHAWLNSSPQWSLASLCVGRGIVLVEGFLSQWPWKKILNLLTGQRRNRRPGESRTPGREIAAELTLRIDMWTPHPQALPGLVVPQSPPLGRKVKAGQSRMPKSLVWGFQGPRGPPHPKVPKFRVWRH